MGRVPLSAQGVAATDVSENASITHADGSCHSPWPALTSSRLLVSAFEVRYGLFT